jgi:type IV pilus assembly protein PilX
MDIKSTTKSAMRSNQNGAVLIVALIMLLVLTILGVAALQGSNMEERMAGNMHDRNLAFQAAETGLLDAENFIENLVTTGNFDGTNGLLGESDSEPDYFASATWSNSNSKEADTAVPKVASQPRYIIKFIAVVDDETGGALNQKRYGKRGSVGDVSMFRITVRANGGSPTSQVILQAHYGKIF